MEPVSRREAPARISRGQSLESVIPKLKIQTLKAQLALRSFVCASLAQEFDTAMLTFEQRAILAHRWDETLKESHVLQIMLDLLERQERMSNQIIERGGA